MKNNKTEFNVYLQVGEAPASFGMLKAEGYESLAQAKQALMEIATETGKHPSRYFVARIDTTRYDVEDLGIHDD